VRIRDEQFVDEVLVPYRCSRLAAPSPPLCVVVGDRLRFRIARVRKRDDDVLLLDQVFDRQVGVILADLRASLVTESIFELGELGPDDFEQPLGPREDLAETLNLDQELAILGRDLVLLEPGQTIEPQIQYRLGLRFGESIAAIHEPEIACEPVRAHADASRAFEEVRYGTWRPEACCQCESRVGGRR
jgi:hypothetical protein